MQGAKLLLVFAFVVSFSAVYVPEQASAASATLFIAPGSGTYSVGQSFTVSVVASSSDQMNAAEASLSFNTSTLSVTGTSKSGSVFSLWTEEPSYSNSQGTIRFGGGNPSGFSGNSTLLKITFRTKAAGTARVSFTDGAVLAADGKGTNILTNMSPATFTVEEAAAPPPPPPSSNNNTGNNTSSSSGTVPPEPEVTSSTHPDPEGWYNVTTGEFAWEVPSDVTSVRLLLSQEEDDTPTVRYAPPISSRTLEDLEDGVWYLHVRFGNSAGLGDIASYKVQTDTVPPGEFSFEVISDDGRAQPELRLEASDELSGIGFYEISVDGEESAIIPIEQVNEGVYEMEPLEKGNHTITVTAIDKAGNQRDAGGPAEVEVTEEIKVSKTVEPEEEGPGFFAKYGTAIWVFIFILIIAGLIALNIMQRKKLEELKLDAMRETKEVRGTIEKVLSALRDEAEELFAKMDGKGGLNDKEGASFKQLKEAIDISEELIAREVDDVEKLFK